MFLEPLLIEVGPRLTDRQDFHRGAPFSSPAKFSEPGNSIVALRAQRFSWSQRSDSSASFLALFAEELARAQLWPRRRVKTSLKYSTKRLK